MLPHGICINPLNWKLDETYAPASLNLGSLVEDENTGEAKIADIGVDAQINLARGVVVTNAQIPPMPEEVIKVAAQFFGPDARHDNDYTYFYNNIKDNVAKRIATYKRYMPQDRKDRCRPRGLWQDFHFRGQSECRSLCRERRQIRVRRRQGGGRGFHRVWQD